MAGMTAANTQAVQTQQVAGQRPTADMLMRKKKKPMPGDKPTMPGPPAGRPTADMLMQRRKK